MSLTSLPFDVLPPATTAPTTEPASDSGSGTAGVFGVVALSAGVIVLVTVVALYVIARRRRRSGGQMGGAQWNR